VEITRFTIPMPALLSKVVEMVGFLMGGRDTKGDFYKCILGRIATAGQNGQFRRNQTAAFGAC
jgi:hypothetical protein